jgi:hypothetical protein
MVNVMKTFVGPGYVQPAMNPVETSVFDDVVDKMVKEEALTFRKEKLSRETRGEVEVKGRKRKRTTYNVGRGMVLENPTNDNRG